MVSLELPNSTMSKNSNSRRKSTTFLSSPSSSFGFYDDPDLSYTIDSPPVKNWDEKRTAWLRQHPSFAAGAESRILMVTGSQAAPCRNTAGATASAYSTTTRCSTRRCNRSGPRRPR
ncbi:hypothetical protein SASPL_151981 [Salvia splendens]|uniref:Uncharacterized protein n=1 Tax=Salvia splendens TaxID=180675 RepID=A0A8X8W2Z3_SALSN|nr:hypothetical protein SASPL_151981 [Salvia splendens]